MYVQHLLVKNVTNRQRKNAKGQKWSQKPDRKKIQLLKKKSDGVCMLVASSRVRVELVDR